MGTATHVCTKLVRPSLVKVLYFAFVELLELRIFLEIEVTIRQRAVQRTWKSNRRLT